VRIPESALDFTFSSSSGPGGQNVNKRATKCTLRLALHAIPISAAQRHRLADLASWLVTGAGDLVIQADENRSQERNRSACLERLRELIIAAKVPPKIRRATKPSRGAKERRIQDKKVRGEIKRGRRGEE
jgi:ribosome-associated protein